MENMTMNPMSSWRVATPSTHYAASATVLDICDVRDVDVRDAVRVTKRPVIAALPAAPKAALVVERDRAIATATGHAGFVAGTRPGSPAWSPPL